jgi:2-aminoadipate transaminase
MREDQLLSFKFAEAARRAVDQPISELMRQGLENPRLISLAAGLVDDATLPTEATLALARQVLGDADRGRAALQYGTTAGLAPLRQLIVEHCAALDGRHVDALNIDAGHVVVATGSQQLLQIITELLVEPGDIVVTAWPSYFVYTSLLTSAGAVVRGVDMDAQGMVPEALEHLLDRLAADDELARVKIVYVTSYHQNPTGLTLSQERRPQLLEIVRRYSEHPRGGGRILLLEDAAYRELTYSGEPPRSIWSYDLPRRHVALLQTFSKPFAPGLKTGYGLLPPDLVGPVLRVKGNHDFGSANFCQHLLREAMRGGVYAEHVRQLRASYAVKRDAMLAALDAELDDVPDVHWTRPDGGLYVWLTLPSRVDAGGDGPLFAEALRRGVLYVPGAFCYGPDPSRRVPRHTLRLSFGVPDVERIRAGVHRLAAALRQVLADDAPAIH